MSSSVLEIYDALAAKTVSVASSVAYGTVTPQVKNLDDLPERVESSMLPCRLLLPLGGITEQDHSIQADVFGDNPASTYTWKITDLLLWRETELGTGIASVASDLIAYTGAYLDMLRSFRYPTTQDADTNQSVLVSARVLRGQFEYPARSGNWYTGVECVLTIEEYVG